jgi:hypothetical protein
MEMLCVDLVYELMGGVCFLLGEALFCPAGKRGKGSGLVASSRSLQDPFTSTYSVNFQKPT